MTPRRSCGNTRRQASVPTTVLILPNCHSCFSNSIEHGTCFLLLKYLIKHIEGHFWVGFCLFFKTNLCAIRFKWKWFNVQWANGIAHWLVVTETQKWLISFYPNPPPPHLALLPFYEIIKVESFFLQWDSKTKRPPQKLTTRKFLPRRNLRDILYGSRRWNTQCIVTRFFVESRNALVHCNLFYLTGLSLHANKTIVLCYLLSLLKKMLSFFNNFQIMTSI